MKALIFLAVMCLSVAAFAATYDTNTGVTQNSGTYNPVIEKNTRQDAIDKSDTRINRYKNTPDGDPNEMRRNENERNSQINQR